MLNKQQQFIPPMPELGHTEAYYREVARAADRMHHIHAREAAKVGQYVTLGTTEDTDPATKMKYFHHALRRHCVPPPVSDDMVESFYERLADFVRDQAGREALRIASMEDDRYAMRLRDGEPRPKIVFEARRFFDKLMGSQDWCPEIFKEEDWEQLCLIRRQWLDEEASPG